MMSRAPYRTEPVEMSADKNSDELSLAEHGALPKGRQSVVSFIDLPVTTAADKVRYILSEGDDSGFPSLDSQALFTQFDVLAHFQDGTAAWKEISRWLKYEETVEVGDRWSKPHVPTTSMHGVLQLKRSLLDGNCIVGLNVKAESQNDTIAGTNAISSTVTNGDAVVTFELLPTLPLFFLTIVDVLARMLQRRGQIGEVACSNIRDIIQQPHKHKHRRFSKTPSSSSLTNLNSERRNSNYNTSGTSSEERRNSNYHTSSDDEAPAVFGASEARKKSILRVRSGDNMDVASALYNYPSGTTAENLAPYKPNKQLTKKLPKNCEAANVLVGQVDFLSDVVMSFCRLETPAIMADLTEVAIPTRFVFIILGPKDGPENAIWEYSDIGRAMASLLNDKVFCQVAYKAKTVQDLIDGIDEYMDGLTVLPPSIWDPSTRLEPPKHTISMDKIRLRLDSTSRGPSAPESEPQEEGVGDDYTLKRTGRSLPSTDSQRLLFNLWIKFFRFFGGLIQDVTHRYRLYGSDIKDVLHPQCIASIIFLYFACVSPIVTFGGLLSQKTDNYLGTMEILLSGAICGVLYALFAGQPLTLVGATGPLIVFEAILYQICKDNSLDFMSFRFWISMWVALALLIIVAFDLSALVRYITRFTEESFSVLVSLIFIYEAIDKVIEIVHEDGVRTGETRAIDKFWEVDCHCIYVNNTSEGVNGTQHVESLSVFPFKNSTIKVPEKCMTAQNSIEIRPGCLKREQCVHKLGWTLSGEYGCSHVPDVFFLSVILFLGTFVIAYALRIFRNSPFFPTVARSTLADFAVPLSVITWTGVDYAFGLATPKLIVPDEFKPTRPERDWIVNPMRIDPWWLIIVALLPAILATILIFLDQQITAVIVNRKEHKLKKGHGYHLDLLVLAVLIAICAILCMPWFVAATVQSISHVQSLMRESEVKIPGERPQIVGVREQRVTGMVVHILVGLSTQLTAVLKLIPMPVLYGVFLYMGITALLSVQFVHRILIIFMPVKYQPDFIYLRHVTITRVHLFTLLQLICMIAMWCIKTIKTTAIAFPVMLIALMAFRKVMDFIFTQSDLYWLDNLLPDDTRRAKEDEAKEHGGRKPSINGSITSTLNNQQHRTKHPEDLYKRDSLSKDPEKLSNTTTISDVSHF